jgi:hypothetical protein
MAEEFVDQLMYILGEEFSYNANIIIHRRGQGKWLEDPQGIVPGGRRDYEGGRRWYSALIFTGPGKFERQGDGGFDNWRFLGWWERESDRVVRFFETRPGPRTKVDVRNSVSRLDDACS